MCREAGRGPGAAQRSRPRQHAWRRPPDRRPTWLRPSAALGAGPERARNVDPLADGGRPGTKVDAELDFGHGTYAGMARPVSPSRPLAAQRSAGTQYAWRMPFAPIRPRVRRGSASTVPQVSEASRGPRSRSMRQKTFDNIKQLEIWLSHSTVDTDKVD